MAVQVLLKKARAAFVNNLVDATDYQDNGVFRRSITLLIEPGSENDKAIRNAIKQAAKQTFGDKAEKTLKTMEGNSNKYCYQDGNNKPDYSGFEDMWFVAAHRNVKDGPPLLLDSIAGEDGKPARLLVTQNDGTIAVKPGKEGRIYAGCFVNSKIEIYAQAGKNPGIRASLLVVQFAGEGDSFGGASRPSDEGLEAEQVSEDAPESIAVDDDDGQY